MTYTLKQARQLRGFSQQEMAKKLRVSRGKYRRIEEKPGETQFRTAIEICKVLDMSLSDIDFLAN